MVEELISFLNNIFSPTIYLYALGDSVSGRIRIQDYPEIDIDYDTIAGYIGIENRYFYYSKTIMNVKVQVSFCIIEALLKKMAAVILPFLWNIFQI